MNPFMSLCSSIVTNCPFSRRNHFSFIIKTLEKHQTDGRRMFKEKYGKLDRLIYLKSKSEIKIINDVKSFVKFDT